MACYEACETAYNSQVWVDEDGHTADEHSNRLAADGKYRVFEVIPGGKH